MCVSVCECVWYQQVAGTVIMGLGAPMLANACTGLSAKWFGVNERNFPTVYYSFVLPSDCKFRLRCTYTYR